MHVPQNSLMTNRKLTLGSIVNKQLNDKERVAAALENPALLAVLEECLEPAQNRINGHAHQFK